MQIRDGARLGLERTGPRPQHECRRGPTRVNWADALKKHQNEANLQSS